MAILVFHDHGHVYKMAMPCPQNLKIRCLGSVGPKIKNLGSLR
jgi:hypothetical protein